MSAYANKTDDELNALVRDLDAEVRVHGRAYQAARMSLSAVRSELAARMRARASKKAG